MVRAKGEMPKEELLERIRKCSGAEIFHIIALTAFQLTIQARDTYGADAASVKIPARLRALNECQHFLLGIMVRSFRHEDVDLAHFADSLGLLCEDEHAGEDVLFSVRRALRAG